jgi:hypothetical protein
MFGADPLEHLNDVERLVHGGEEPWGLTLFGLSLDVGPISSAAAPRPPPDPTAAAIRAVEPASFLPFTPAPFDSRY